MNWRDKLAKVNNGNCHVFMVGSTLDVELCRQLDKLVDRGYKIKFEKWALDTEVNLVGLIKAIKKGISIRFTCWGRRLQGPLPAYHTHFFVMTDTGGYMKMHDNAWGNGGKAQTFDQLLEKVEDYKVPERIRAIDEEFGFDKPVVLSMTHHNQTTEFFHSNLLYHVEAKAIVGVDGTKVNSEAVAIKDNDIWFLLLGKGRSGTVEIISDGITYKYVKIKYNYRTQVYSATLTRKGAGKLTVCDQELIKCAINWYVECLKKREDK
jgi:hypothetical protein